jgi:hypothetical protein
MINRHFTYWICPDWPYSAYGRTYLFQGPDISSLPGLFTLLSVDSSWVPHRAFTSFFSTHALYSLMFGVPKENGSW